MLVPLRDQMFYFQFNCKYMFRISRIWACLFIFSPLKKFFRLGDWDSDPETSISCLNTILFVYYFLIFVSSNTIITKTLWMKMSIACVRALVRSTYLLQTCIPNCGPLSNTFLGTLAHWCLQYIDIQLYGIYHYIFIWKSNINFPSDYPKFHIFMLNF